MALTIASRALAETGPRVRVGEPAYGGTLRLLGPGGLDHLDTACAYTPASSQVLRALTRQLFAYPASSDLSVPARPVADVAAAVPTRHNGGISADGLTYTVRLRSDVRWDTVPPRAVTAHDFVRGFKRLGNPVARAGGLGYYTGTILGMREYCDAYRSAFADREPTACALAGFQRAHRIAGVRAHDDATLVIRLLRPAADFLDVLALTFASPVPEEYDNFVPDSLELRTHLRSLGPYRLDRYLDGGRTMRLVRNRAWSAQSDPVRAQFVDAVEFTFSSAPASAIRAEIDASAADLAWSLPTASWVGHPTGAPGRGPSCYSGYALNPYLVFNLCSPNARAAVQNPLVRRAIAGAIDKTAVAAIMAALDAPCRTVSNLIPPGSPGHRDDRHLSSEHWGCPTAARQLLAAAGRGDGVALVAAVRDVDIHLAVMDSVAADLRSIGIDLRIDRYDQGTYYGSLLSDPERARAGAWDLALAGWTPDWFGNNGRAVLPPLVASSDLFDSSGTVGTSGTAGTTNYGGYSDPQVDRLIADALAEPDPARADERWRRVDRRVMRDVPVVPILAVAATMPRYHSPRVRNALYLTQSASLDITNIWLDADPADRPGRVP
jgi:peptide/nickel transport system substrate-binding protein